MSIGGLHLLTHKAIEGFANAFHGFKVRLAQEFNSQGLSNPPVHLKVLRLIDTLAPCTSQNLAQVLERDKAQVTRLLQDMKNLGLVEQTANPEDKRSHFLQLTHLGKTQLQTMVKAEKQILRAVSQALTKADQEQLMALLGRVNDALRQ